MCGQPLSFVFAGSLLLLQDMQSVWMQDLQSVWMQDLQPVCFPAAGLTECYE